MSTVHVTASGSYDVEISAGCLSTLGMRAAALVKGRCACVVSDDTVFSLHGAKAVESLEKAGFSVCTFVFPHGEQSKNGETFLALVNALAEAGLTRSDVLVALGGGVTGDLTGFASACYLRGIACVQVPTTLLAMVDSSVGGKTAIDLPAGKNLCGAFCQPRLVLCDTELLQTLPTDIFRDGCAEVIKYAILGDKPLFETLKHGISDDLEAVITACVEAKGQLVEEDEFDTGSRQFLNLGHTLGHAVEANSGFSLSHGQAVSVGMAMMARAAAKFGFCTEHDRDAMLELLTRYDLPITTDQASADICRTALGDKKRRGGTLTLVVPCAIGQCILHPVPVEELPRWVQAGR